MSVRPGYAGYLQSSHWRKARDAKMAAAYWCEDCGVNVAKHVHHKTYERLGCEEMGDLMALCPPCHQNRHPDNRWLDPIIEDDNECEMCAGGLAEIFVGTDRICVLCLECGDDYWYPRYQRRSAA